MTHGPNNETQPNERRCETHLWESQEEVNGHERRDETPFLLFTFSPSLFGGGVDVRKMTEMVEDGTSRCFVDKGVT